MELYLSQFITLMIAHVLAMASPGQDFALILKYSVSYGRKIGRATALGIGSGILVHAAYTVLGLSFIIYRSPTAFMVLRLLGGAYLIFIGLKAWLGKHSPLNGENNPEKKEPTLKESYLTGFFTNVLNPRVTLFFLAIFTAIVSIETPPLIKMGYGAVMSFLTMLWFGLLATLLSLPKIREGFLKAGIWFDRIMGSVLLILGIKLIFF